MRNWRIPLIMVLAVGKILAKPTPFQLSSGGYSAELNGQWRAFQSKPISEWSGVKLYSKSSESLCFLDSTGVREEEKVKKAIGLERDSAMVKEKPPIERVDWNGNTRAYTWLNGKNYLVVYFPVEGLWLRAFIQKPPGDGLNDRSLQWLKTVTPLERRQINK